MKARAEEVDIDRVHQRTVSARGAAPIASLAARSVFDVARDAAKRPRKAAPEFDPDAVKVEKGVAIPTNRLTRESKYAALLRRLEVGTSAALPVEHKASLTAAAHTWAKKTGAAFTIRVVSETDVRIWRTA